MLDKQKPKVFIEVTKYKEGTQKKEKCEKYKENDSRLIFYTEGISHIGYLCMSD